LLHPFNFTTKALDCPTGLWDARSLLQRGPHEKTYDSLREHIPDWTEPANHLAPILFPADDELDPRLRGDPRSTTVLSVASSVATPNGAT